MDQTNAKKVLIMGTAVGAVTGLLAAYLIIKRAENKNEEPNLSPGEGVKIGLGVLGLLRSLSD